MFSGILAALLLLSPNAAEKRVAMVLDVKGPDIIRGEGGAIRPAKVMGLVSEEEHVIVPAEGEATLVFTEDNHREQVKPGMEVTIGSDGCTPPEAVERGEALRVAVAYRDVPRLSGLERGAAPIFREPGMPDQSFAVSPMFGSTVATNRPTLSWPAVADAPSYRVQLVRGRMDAPLSKERIVWTAETKEPRLSYPPSAAASH